MLIADHTGRTVHTVRTVRTVRTERTEPTIQKLKKKGNCRPCWAYRPYRTYCTYLLYVPNLTYVPYVPSGVVVVERLERSLQFLFSRVERRSSSWFSCFSSMLLISIRNWHLTSIITGKLPRHMQLCVKSCISYVNLCMDTIVVRMAHMYIPQL